MCYDQATIHLNKHSAEEKTLWTKLSSIYHTHCHILVQRNDKQDILKIIPIVVIYDHRNVFQRSYHTGSKISGADIYFEKVHCHKVVRKKISSTIRFNCNLIMDDWMNQVLDFYNIHLKLKLFCIERCINIAEWFLIWKASLMTE